MFSKLKNCTKCGRMFQADDYREKLCSRCRGDDEAIFKEVREYLYDHPKANAQEVAEETEATEELVMKWLRAGRLELKGEGVGYPCDHCGVSITTGRFCKKCADEMAKGFKAAMGADKPSEPTIQKKKPNEKMFTKKG